MLAALSAQAQEAPRFRHMISLGIGTTASYDIQIGCDDEVLYDNWGPFYYGARTYHQAQSYLENTYQIGRASCRERV